MIKRSLLIIFVLSFLMTFFSIMICFSNINKKIKAMTYLKSYSYTYDTPFTFDLLIYFNRDNKYTNLDDINNFYIECGENKINVNVKSIKKGNKYKYNNDIYYAYKYEIYININGIVDYNLAKFVIDDKSFDIGSLYLIYKNNGNLDIDITKMSAITAGLDSINALQLELKPKKDLIIKDIRISNTVFMDLNNSLKITNTYNETEKLDDIIKDYNDKCIIWDSPNSISLNETVYLLIPLKYKYDYIIQSCPIIINYMIDDKDYEYIFDNFTFINSNDKLITQKGVNRYEFNMF